MKRTFAFIFAALLAVALFGVLVYAVLVTMQVSDSAASPVHGATPRRLWATSAVVLGLGGVVVGGLALSRSDDRLGRSKKEAILALPAGVIAAVNGGLNLAVATGGLGSGNGVAGGAAALVLGLMAMALGGLALARLHRSDSPA